MARWIKHVCEVWSFQRTHRLLLEINFRWVKAIWYKRVCFVNKLSLSHWYDDVFKTFLFRWFFIGFASFIQAEIFSHLLSRQRIITIILCLDRGCEKFSAWINDAKPRETHRESNIFNTSRYKWENDNLLTKHTLLCHTALTTRARKSIPSSNLCPLWNDQSSQPFPNYNVKPTVSRSLIDAQH